MVKFCLNNRYGMAYAIYECMCNDCNWMGELRALTSDNWDHYRYCPMCGGDDIDEFDDGNYREYIIMPTEWGTHNDNDVDTGYEKPIEYGKSKGVEMVIKDKIMATVIEREKYKRCLDARVCPDCGEDLIIITKPNGIAYIKCCRSSCKFNEEK